MIQAQDTDNEADLQTPLVNEVLLLLSSLTY